MIPALMLQIMSQMIPNFQQFQNAKSPDDLAQQLLNSGRVSQDQVNRAKQMWNQPNIRQMVQSKFKF